MKVTKKQKYWLDVIQKRGGVFKYYNSHGNADYQILNSSEEINKGMVERLLKKNLLVPQNDGLHGDSQVYKVLEA